VAAAFGLARVQVRARWRALVALGLLIGVVGAAALGALAGARRTATAYERLERVTHIDDVRLLVFAPGLAERAAALPSVERSWIAEFSVGRPDGPDETYFGITSGPPRPPDLFQPILVEGRMFDDDRVEEVVIAEQFAKLSGLGPGDEVPMKMLTAEELGLFDVGFGEPDGPRIALEIVGMIRIPSAEEGFSLLFGTPALARLVEDDLSAGQVAMLRLKDGLSGLDRFRAELRPLAENVTPPPGSEEFEPYEETLPRSSRSSVGAASTVLVAGLMSFAGVVLVVGGFIVIQAVGRYSAQGAQDQLVERALGMTLGERVLARAIPAVLPGLIGAVVAIVGAILTSRYTPIGSVASYEPSPGIELNAALFGLGGAAVLLGSAAVFGFAAFRASRAAPEGAGRSASRIAERIGAMGGSTPLLVGLRFALERGRGRTTVPVRSAFVGATLGIAGLIAVASFAASLDRLESTPERYGWQGHLQIVDLKPEQRSAMRADPRVEEFSVLSTAQAATPDGRLIAITGFEHIRGELAWTMLEGRMPATSEEVAIGPRFAERLGVSVGGVLSFADPASGATVRKAVVGIGLGPIPSNSPFGDHAALTPEGFAGVARTQAFTEGYIRLADGVDEDAFVEELSGTAELTRREPPPEVRNLFGLGRLPDVLAGILALIAVAAIVNALVVGVRRRRRDIAILRSLGFVRTQVVRAVQTSALTMTLTAVVLGTPIGLAIGRAVWRPIARSAFVAGDPAWPGTLMAIVLPGALLVGIAAAAFPALRAARLRPAEILRAE
jgi:putative ABC transport system permease protein